jgi:hypothetical protein
VSKDFDSTLSAAIDLAAAAAQTSGASAARIRGRQRTVRKRIAVSTASAVLIAVGATAAFKISSPHNGTPQLTTTTSQATASPSATSSPSSGATSQPTTSPSSSPAITADPHKTVQGAWLSAAQLPFATTQQWKASQSNPQGSSPIGQPLTATVFYVAKDTSLQALTACADPTALLGRTTGAQHTDYTSAQGAGVAASQFVFFFADATSAQQAFSWLQSQYSPSCQTASGMTVTRTAGDGQTSAAWLIVKGASGPIDAASYTREFFVLRGGTIGYVSVSAAAGGLPTAWDDNGQLSTVAAHLCVYGGVCQ